MLKIFCNHEKQDITYSYTLGQAFPDVKGKLLRVEMNGKELDKLREIKEIPLNDDAVYLAWNGKQAGHILKLFREVLEIKT